MLDWIWCFDVKHHKARVFSAEKRDLSFTSINLVPRVFHLPTPKGAREERPWFRLVTCLCNKFIFEGGVPIYQSIVAAAVCYLLRTGSLGNHGKLFFARIWFTEFEIKSSPCT